MNAPDWIIKEFIKPCEFCGTMYEFGYSPDGGRITKHYCPNHSCPGTIAQKIVYLVTTLGIKGIKEGTAMQYVKQYNLTHHLQVLPLLYNNEKPRMTLAQFMKICAIPGIDTQWESICYGKTFDEVLSSGYVPLDQVDSIKMYKESVDIITQGKMKYEPVYSCNVMITGDIIGFEPRENFIKAINLIFEGYVSVGYYKSKRKTGVDFLIKEENSDITGKVAVAKQARIPIVTSSEFFETIISKVQERIGDKIYDLKGLYSE